MELDPKTGSAIFFISDYLLGLLTNQDFFDD